MSSRSGAKYWMWMKSKPAGDNENVFYSTNTVSSNKVVFADEANNWEERTFAVDSAGSLGGFIWPPRSYTCSFCGREFRSAQALGGHMNVHRRDRARLKESDPPPIDHYNTTNNNMRRSVAYSSDHSIVSLLPLSSTQEIRDVNKYAQMKEATGSTIVSLDLPQTSDPVLVKALNSSGSTDVCQSALKLDGEKSSSKAHEIEILDDELAKEEDSTARTGSAVSLSSNMSRIGNKRRRRDIPPSLTLSLLHSYNTSMDVLDLELRL